MGIGNVIASARKAKNMTQEALGNAVGVSSAAVSKWETEASYPDITLLKPVARALGLTLDGLFEFHSEPDKAERQEITKRLEAAFENEGYPAGVAACSEVLKEYPSCGSLKLAIAGLYYRYISIAVTEKKDAGETLDKMCRIVIPLLEQAEEETTDDAEKQAAKLLRMSALIMQERFDEAEGLLDTMPERPLVEPEMLYWTLYLSKGELDKAEKLCEKMLLGAVSKALMALNGLSDVASRRGDTETAYRLISVYREVSEIFGLDSSAGFQLELLLSAEENDKERALKLIGQFVDARLESSYDYSKNLFFSALQTRTPSQAEIKAANEVILKLFEKPLFDFVRDEPEFENAVTRLRKSLFQK